MPNFFYLSEILLSWIQKKRKWGVCCKTVSGIPPANAPLLLSPQVEMESFAFGMGMVCILQLGRAHLFLSSGRQRQPKEALAWLHCKEILAWAPTGCCDYDAKRKMYFIYNVQRSCRMFLKIGGCPVNSLSTEFNKQSAAERAPESFQWVAGCFPSPVIFLTEVK